MKVNYKTSNGRISVEIEGDSQETFLLKSQGFRKYLRKLNAEKM